MNTKNSEIATAFVLINCKLGCQSQVADKLKTIKNITEVIQVNGSYDIIAKVEHTTNELRDIITWKIRKISDIASTLTIMKKQDN